MAAWPGSDPIFERDIAAKTVEDEGQGDAEGYGGHVERQGPTCEGVFRSGEYGQEVAGSEEEPGKRAVAIGFGPHEPDRGDGGAYVRGDGHEQSVLRQLPALVQENPHDQRGDAEQGAEPLGEIRFLPFFMPPNTENHDEGWIREAEHGRPGIGMRARAPIREQDRETDESPERPTGRDRMNLSFVCPDGIGNDAEKNQTAGQQAYRLGVQVGVPAMSLLAAEAPSQFFAS